MQRCREPTCPVAGSARSPLSMHLIRSRNWTSSSIVSSSMESMGRVEDLLPSFATCFFTSPPKRAEPARLQEQQSGPGPC